MNQSQELQTGRWYSRQTGPCSETLVCALRPTGREVRAFGAGGLGPAGQLWEALTEDGRQVEVSALDIGRRGIGELRGPVDALPMVDDETERALRAKFRQAQHKAEQDRKAAAETAAAERAALPGAYPHLVPMAGTRKSQHAAGAANLGRELALAFPGIKFSVRSKSYSGGCSISVHWLYGPPERDVERICKRYENRDFDGMQDLETIRENRHADVFGGAHYVHASRTIPHDGTLGADWFGGSLFGAIGRELCRLQGVDYAGAYTAHLCGAHDRQSLVDHVNRLLDTISFPAGFRLDDFGGIERAPWTDEHGYEGGQPWRIVIQADGGEHADA